MTATATEIDPILQNYEVPARRLLIVRGKEHNTGDVLTGIYLNWDGGLAAKIAAGHVIPTTKPARDDLVYPEPVTQADPNPAIARELDHFRRQTHDLEAGNRLLQEQLAAKEAELKLLNKGVLTQAGEIARVRAENETLATKVAELTAKLDKPAPITPSKPKGG